MAKEIKRSLSSESLSPPPKRVNTRCSAFSPPSQVEARDPLNGTLPPPSLNEDEPAPGETSPPEQKPFPDPALLALAQASAESPSASFRELIESRTKSKLDNEKISESLDSTPKKTKMSLFNKARRSQQSWKRHFRKAKTKFCRVKKGHHGQDPYCWECHDPDAEETCSLCVRSFHGTCIGHPIESSWSCAECRLVNSFIPRVQIPDNKLAPCLQIFINFFIKEAQISPELFVFPGVKDRTVVYPIDLQTISANIRNMRYKSIQAFASDLRWLHHNAAICFGTGHKACHETQEILTSFQRESSEMANCTNCYKRCYSAKPSWFTSVCDPPHPLVWARPLNYPFWPAKAFFLKNDSVQCQFFGQHDVDLVPLSRVYLVSEKHPSGGVRKRPSLVKALAEMKTYVHNYIQKFGQFTFAPVRTQLLPQHFKPPYQSCLTLPKPSPTCPGSSKDDGEPQSPRITKVHPILPKPQESLPKVEESLICLGLSRPCRVVLKKLDLSTLPSMPSIYTEEPDDKSVEEPSCPASPSLSEEESPVLNTTDEASIPSEENTEATTPFLVPSQMELIQTLNKNLETLNQRLSQDQQPLISTPDSGGDEATAAPSNSERAAPDLSHQFETFKTELKSILEEYFGKHNEQLNQQCEAIGEKLNTVTEECGYISIENREVLARTYKLESTQQNVVADECHLLFSKIKKELSSFQEQLIKQEVKNNFLSGDAGEHLCSRCGAKASFQCCSSAYYCSARCQKFQPLVAADACSSIFENMEQPTEASQSFLGL